MVGISVNKLCELTSYKSLRRVLLHISVIFYGGVCSIGKESALCETNNFSSVYLEGIPKRLSTAITLEIFGQKVQF